MTPLERIREQIKKLYETNPDIHMNVDIKTPKTVLKNAKAKLTGVYSHIFQIEEYTSGKAQTRTLQYIDILTGSIAILELKGKE